MLKKWTFLFPAVFLLVSCGDEREGSAEQSEERVQLSEARKVALENYEKTKSQYEAEAEDALYQLIVVLDEEGDNEVLLGRIEEYLANNRFRNNKSAVRFLKGHTLAKLGKKDEAINLLGELIETNMGFVKCSTPAVGERSRLLWARNRPAGEGRISDREEAQRMLKFFFQKTERIVPKFTDDEKQEWYDLKEALGDFGIQLNR